MHDNLKKELSRKGITQVALANMLGLTEKTIQNKIKGDTEFTLREAFYIWHNLLPEFNLDYLFMVTE